jgi:hypothetical protein
MASQIASQLAKTFTAPSTSFFPEGGKDPFQLPAYIPKKLPRLKKRSWTSWKQKVLRSVQEGQKIEVEDVPRGVS